MEVGWWVIGAGGGCWEIWRLGESEGMGITTEGEKDGDGGHETKACQAGG